MPIRILHPFLYRNINMITFEANEFMGHQVKDKFEKISRIKNTSFCQVPALISITNMQRI